MQNPLSRRDRRLAARVSEPVDGFRPTAPAPMSSTRFRPAAILTAAEQFLSKTPAQREGLIRLVMEGHLRGIIG